MTAKSTMLWAFALSSVAVFMTASTTSSSRRPFPIIRANLGGGIEALEWTVNAYTLTFAVLLLTGAATASAAGACSPWGWVSSRLARRRRRLLPRSSSSSPPGRSRVSAARSSRRSHSRSSRMPCRLRSAALRLALGVGSAASR